MDSLAIPQFGTAFGWWIEEKKLLIGTELNYFLRKHKWMPKPTFVLTPENPNYSGCYYKPEKNKEVYINGKHYDLKNGVVVITEADQIDSDTVLAHEFRHHWQFCKGINERSKWNPTGNYKRDIISYFTKHKTEIDALLYSIKFKKSDLDCEWLEWIIKEQELLLTFQQSMIK